MSKDIEVRMHPVMGKKNPFRKTGWKVSHKNPCMQVNYEDYAVCIDFKKKGMVVEMYSLDDKGDLVKRLKEFNFKTAKKVIVSDSE